MQIKIIEIDLVKMISAPVVVPIHPTNKFVGINCHNKTKQKEEQFIEYFLKRVNNNV